jgi:hypothetical protein
VEDDSNWALSFSELNIMDSALHEGSCVFVRYNDVLNKNKKKKKKIGKKL